MKETKKGEDTKRNAKLVGAAVVTVILVGWTGKQILPVFFPTLFIPSSSSSSAPNSPPPPPSPEPAATPPPADDGGSPQVDSHPPDYWASQALETADRDYTPEKIAAEPAVALRIYFKIVRGFPECAAAKTASKKVEDIRSKFAKQLAAANTAAQANLDRVKAGMDAKLADLDHTDVIGSLQALEDKYAGLPVGDQAAKERERIEGLWKSVSAPEKAARRDFQKLPELGKLEPGAFADDRRIQLALQAQEIATTYSNTLFGQRAAARRDELLGPVADEVESYGGSTSGQDLARRIPKELKDTPPGRRIAAVRPRASAPSPKGK